MTKAINLTEGSIFKALIKLAMPIIGTSFVQMAYNMTDMIWMGRVGAKEVAAVGTAGFFTWLAMAIILIPKIGAEVGVSQSIGRRDADEAKKYIKHSMQMIIFLAILYGAFLIIFRKPLIGFYKLGEAKIVNDAVTYLVIISIGMVFYTINPVFTAVFNGYGDSKTPFNINVIGLIMNMVLDPLLILGVGPFPRLEAAGAGIATVIAQVTVTIVFIREARKRRELFPGLGLFTRPDIKHIKTIVKLGFPVALQSGLFTIFAMITARIIAQWGPIPIAVQKVGSQIESISWMTAGGFQSAMSAFIGQNYGAKKWDRVFKGYFSGLAIVSIIGIFATCLLIFGARPVFSVFIPEEEAISYGIVYLKILGLSQLFMCIEITTAGAFIGHGKTLPPSIVGILFNALRIPGALILSSTFLGLDGVWWAISISSILKGVVLSTWHILFLKRNPNTRQFRFRNIVYM
ncbi:MATE family efflux transporter [Lutispora saccharofermentans]|uniref:Probable multidrug resistance protein NorM n=1 Tax=Lutispora saccharofermentans TaxID=3024236 RepID=A0ABT1NFJ6_9FIRM|nr:MATE family efflux transporter [Lutispora saccharofermentans]MCQ1530035.1 MATE family efflux transporter [Lutispora saccharofermentans]